MARRILMKNGGIGSTTPPAGYQFVGFSGITYSRLDSEGLFPIIGTTSFINSGSTQSGTSGTSGLNGNDGTSGTSGLNGNDGTSGTSGLNGNDGTSGTSGSQGPQGIPGETLSVQGVESNYSSLTQSVGTSYSVPQPTNLTTYVVQDTSYLWIYNPTSTAANSDGWVNMGSIQGPQGATGSTGTNGNDGTSGTSGINGTSGIDGSDGTSGTSGLNGSGGTSGTSGLNGSGGTSGTSGISFTSPYTGNLQINGQIWTPISASSSTTTNTSINFNNSNVSSYTLSTNTTFSLTNMNAGGTYIVVVKQAPSGGPFTASFTGVLWTGGLAPTQTTTANKYDVYTFIYDGVNIFGSYIQNF